MDQKPKILLEAEGNQRGILTFARKIEYPKSFSRIYFLNKVRKKREDETNK
jgi:hypothetical protein